MLIEVLKFFSVFDKRKLAQTLQKGFLIYLWKVGNITPKFPSMSYSIPNSKITQQFDPT